MSNTLLPLSQVGSKLNETGCSPNSRSRFIAPAIGLTFFLIQIPFARISFDSHHDGYMLAAAIGVKDGGVIHRGVMSQYGPTTTLLQSFALLAPLGPALTLRLLTALQLSLTASLVADLGRVAPPHWRFRLRNTTAAALVWILLSDAWRGVAILPWSSVSASTLLALSTWLITRGSRQLLFAKRLEARIHFVLAGCFVGLSGFTRINVGVAAILASLLLALIPRVRRSTERPHIHAFVLGLIASILTAVLLLTAAGALREFVQQAVLDPQRFAPQLVNDWKPIPWLVDTFGKFSPLALLIGIAVHLLKSQRTGLRTIAYIMLSLASLWLLSNPRPGQTRFDTFSNGFLRTSDPAWIATNALLLAFVGSVLGCLSLLVVHLVTQTGSEDGGAISIAAVVALAGLIQVYPTYDSRHIWWGIPIALGLTFNVIGVGLLSRSHRVLALFLLVIPLVPSVVQSARSTLSVPRIPYGSENVLDGMLGTSKEVEDFERKSAFVLGRVGPRDSVFLTADGDLSVIAGEFRSADPYFVDWAPSTPSLLERVRERPDIVSNRIFSELSRITIGTDYFIASRRANLTHLLAPPCIAGNCPGIEPNDVCMSWGSCRPRSAPDPLELTRNTSFSPVGLWGDWNVKVNGGFSYPEDDGAWITGHHARLTFDNTPTDTVRISLLPFLPPEWTHIDINILSDTEATPIRLNDGITTIELPVKANTWNELVFRCDTLRRPNEYGLGADGRLLCAKVVGFEPVS